MTISNHAKRRMQYRQININQVLNCLVLGQKENHKDGIKHTYNNIIVITDKEKSIIITTYYENKINNIIKKLAKKYKVNFAQAINIYKNQIA